MDPCQWLRHRPRVDAREPRKYKRAWIEDGKACEHSRARVKWVHYVLVKWNPTLRPPLYQWCLSYEDPGG